MALSDTNLLKLERIQTSILQRKLAEAEARIKPLQDQIGVRDREIKRLEVRISILSHELKMALNGQH